MFGAGAPSAGVEVCTSLVTLLETLVVPPAQLKTIDRCSLFRFILHLCLINILLHNYTKSNFSFFLFVNKLTVKRDSDSDISGTFDHALTMTWVKTQLQLVCLD